MAFSVGDQIGELEALQRGLDAVDIGHLIPLEKENPKAQIDLTLRRQLKQKFAELARMHFKTAGYGIGRTVSAVRAQVGDLRWSIEARIHRLKSKAARSPEEPRKHDLRLLHTPDGKLKDFVTFRVAAQYGGVTVRAIQKAARDNKIESLGSRMSRRVSVPSLQRYFLPDK